ncbi:MULTISPECIES: MarC family protein [unclassified Colwellia]|jgi:multiple antibiotic resistance protein|uniref:MarC family protein n=1 Tax=unclassified Colwellia TaxID=196834 RepID=UPI0015F4B351|nr:MULTISPECIES: MarC family protein [unclassified Colwellia]MBA6349264.1 MarC family protein [Colwellia sp. BRX8-9]MBA6380661.1 MarC family protein [Colwellia sp. BRX10-7]MBA6388006.1 MarC family protein [Colwellia sp. BRX10-2]MBA6401995.1 MarC family protein [Colwellia sp. BRX10-5]MBA6406449.1 MarC family protein [Colwellia sp. BRX10-1]
MIDVLAVFITFFAVVDPIGTIPVFIAVTAQYDQKTKRRVALLATIVSACVLLFFLIVGEIVLTALSIPLPAFQISGGIVLFLFALNMIFGDSKPDEEIKSLQDSHKETAIFPLAVPSIASPGAMLAAVLLTKNSVYSLWEQTQTALVMLSVLILVYILMLLAGFINRIIGTSGASVISRVMGLILSSIAITNILAGFGDYYKLL